MVSVDIVILSYAKNQECFDTTQKCLDSLFDSEHKSEINFYVIVVEGEEEVKWQYPGVITVKPDLPYGYHKYMNQGRKLGTSEWVALCNNDLIFRKGWFTEILKASELYPSILSFSPIDPYTQPELGIPANSGDRMGYEIRLQISGWCIVQKRKIYGIIGDLDERFVHWYADNDYSMTLWKSGLQHCLVTSSIVEHHSTSMGKVTASVISKSELLNITKNTITIFQKKWASRLSPDEVNEISTWEKIIPFYINQSKKMITVTNVINRIVPEDAAFIFIDDAQWELTSAKGNRIIIPFLERNGVYWGPPMDDEEAIKEVNRLKDNGAAFLVVASPSFWWLDYYKEWNNFLRTNCSCLLESDDLIVFDLKKPVGSLPYKQEKIIRTYEALCNINSDINEHLPVLKAYSEKVDHITEFGVRDAVSTFAFIAGEPKRIVSYDVYRHRNIAEAEELASEKNISFDFILQSTLDAEIESTELLFLDTLHTYTQLSLELSKHSDKVSKYLIFHDVVSFGSHDETIYDHADEKVKASESGKHGLIPAIFELLENNEWEVEKYFYNNNGLLILKRKNS